MSRVAECPCDDDLRKFAAGDVTMQAFDTLAEHVHLCVACLAKVQELSPVDPLVQALAKARTVPDDPESDIVSRLIDKLKVMQAVSDSAAVSPFITFACRQCKKPLKAKASFAGKKVKCPGCGQPTVVHEAGQDRTVDLSVGDSVVGPRHLTADHSFADDGDETTEFLAAPLAPDEMGRLGPYRVLEVLGRGGMGVVFRAEDPSLKRVVALKAMLPVLAVSSTAKKRFLREAQTAASIKHDHIVTIHQVGEDRGVPYLAMEFLQGESLDKRLRREKTLPTSEVIRIGRQIAEGLAAAHDKGLIHRDIKPANIWLETLGRPSQVSRVKILDFGLARSANDASGLTGVGAIVGTPAYMAPEQATGQVVDGRADLFSLGCVLYVMATGRQPFRGADAISTITAVCSSDAVPPRTLDASFPAALSGFILKLIAKNPKDRPSSADAVAAELLAMEGVRAGAPEPRFEADASSVVNVPRVDRTPPARRWPLFAGLAAFAALVALGFVFLVPTPTGTIRVEVNDDEIEVVLTKSGATIKGADRQHDIAVAAGQQGVKVRRGDLEFESNGFVLKKGETVTVKVDFLNGVLQAAADGNIIGQRQIDPAAPARFALRLDMIVVQDGPIVPIPKLRLPTTGPITIEAYVNVLDFSNNGHNPHYFGSPYQFWVDPKGFHWAVKNDKPTPDGTFYERIGIPLPEQNARRWVHYAGVRDGDEHRAYIDGVLIDKKKEPRRLYQGDHVGEVDIGRLVDGTAFKEFRVSTTARYRDNFTPQPRFSPDKATLALFHLDEGEGDIAKDSSGHGYHVPLKGTFATWMKLDEPFEKLKIPPNATWTPTAEQQTYLDTIERLPLREKVEAVTRKIQELNQVTHFPGATPIFEPVDGPPTRCQINDRPVAHLWPLAALTTLEKLDIAATTATDYAPLTRLPLVEIKAPLIIDNVAGEKALQSMATLRSFNDQPASKAWEVRAAIRKDIDNMAKSSKVLSLEDRIVWFAAIMKKLHPTSLCRFRAGRDPEHNGFALYADRGLTRLKGQAISADVFDLSPLRALGVDSVHLDGGRFFDITPLGKSRLKELALPGNLAVRDLSPLTGMPLKQLQIDFVPARDAAVLRSLKSIETINDKPAQEVIDSLP